MRRIYIYLLFLSLSIIGNSCRPSKDYVAPPPDLPAPFSYKPAAVQLLEIRGSDSWNSDHYFDDKGNWVTGTLKEKYIYEKGYLIEHQYISADKQVHQTRYYERHAGTLHSTAYWLAQFYPETSIAGPLDYINTFTFHAPLGDTLRMATFSKPGETSEVRYLTNKEGYLIQTWHPIAGDIYYERNDQNNVIRSRSGSIITYEYDDHPNPFFAMGRFADIPVDTSPHNLLRSISKSSDYIVTTTYQYTYRPDGYPASVVVKRSSSANEPERIQTLTYIYNE